VHPAIDAGSVQSTFIREQTDAAFARPFVEREMFGFVLLHNVCTWYHPMHVGLSIS